MRQEVLQTVLDGVPDSYFPSLVPKEAHEVVFSSFLELDPQTRRMVTAVFYYSERKDEVDAEHEREHAKTGFRGGGAVCEKYATTRATLELRIAELQDAVDQILMSRFGLRMDDAIAFRTEGLTVVSQDPLAGTALPEDPDDDDSDGEEPSAGRRGFMHRILHRSA